MRTRHQIIDDLIEATEYHDTEIILNIDHIRALFNDAIGHLKDASKVVRDNQRMRRNIQQLKSDNAQQARCIENLTDKLNATNDSLPRWISVEEKMPENDANVLVYAIGNNENSCIAMTSYTHNLHGFHIEGWRSPWQYFFHEHKITHWMPLPEPPKEE